MRHTFISGDRAGEKHLILQSSQEMLARPSDNDIMRVKR
jgi:hypothetical protein